MSRCLNLRPLSTQRTMLLPQQTLSASIHSHVPSLTTLSSFTAELDAVVNRLWKKLRSMDGGTRATIQARGSTGSLRNNRTKRTRTTMNEVQRTYYHDPIYTVVHSLKPESSSSARILRSSSKDGNGMTADSVKETPCSASESESVSSASRISLPSSSTSRTWGDRGELARLDGEGAVFRHKPLILMLPPPMDVTFASTLNLTTYTSRPIR